MSQARATMFLLFVLAFVLATGPFATAQDSTDADVFDRGNLVAWCVVPFDDRDRSPEERAAMLERIGVKRLAYDYRAQHVPTFDAEVEALKRHHIELTAWWFPTVLNDEAKLILDVLKRHEVRTQLWVTGGGEPTTNPEEQAVRVKAEADRIRPIAEAAAEIGCSVGLYNHGGWFGEPDNQIAIIEELGLPNVGIVYNQHHGHGHVTDFAALLGRMKPHLLALNLNGMVEGGDAKGQKIVPLGEGELDLKLLRTIRDSGYTGPIGILNHTQENAEHRLLDNLEGLEWLTRQLDGKAAGDRPKLRTWTAPAKEQLSDNTLIDGDDAWRTAPITVDCQATLLRKDVYNILAASDSKRSGFHWEIFSRAGDGMFTAYFPGLKPDHVQTNIMICDGRPHHLAMIYEPARVRLLVDGEVVADQTVERVREDRVPGPLGIGRLVEGEFRCHGPIDWLRITRGAELPAAKDLPKRSASTVLLWVPDSLNARAPSPDSNAVYSAEFVQRMVGDAALKGNATRGANVFASAKFACVSCHKVGQHGGDIGPGLLETALKRQPSELVESFFWPKRHIEPPYVAWIVLTESGRQYRGYKTGESESAITLQDPATKANITIPRREIDIIEEAGTLMPDGLPAAMTAQQQLDVLALLFAIRDSKGDSRQLASIEEIIGHAATHAHTPATFEFVAGPIDPAQWPNHNHHVNRERVYEFYRKQAEYFRDADPRPMVVTAFPGLDGGVHGHWGNQNDEIWTDGRWNDVDLGTMLSGVFRGFGKTVPRAICVRLGNDGELSACFNADTLEYEAVWKGGFLKFSDVRHGFVGGITPDGEQIDAPAPMHLPDTAKREYRGCYRIGRRVAFAYAVDGTEFLDTLESENEQVVRLVADLNRREIDAMVSRAEPQWPTALATPIRHGNQSPYAIDSIEFPWENQWNTQLFPGGHAFLPDGSALICTMQGDVWKVSGFEYPSEQATWKRFASGLHHAQGIVVDKDGIFVLGRDQITRLNDLNNDGEADFYECFSNAFETSPGGHDFICGLERDAEGRFYTASGNQGLVRISADGKSADVIATGFRNPDGLGVFPEHHGTRGPLVTVPCSEGEWTPASMLCAFHADDDVANDPPFFGYRGPKNDQPPSLPLVYLPRGLDNSAGGQTVVNSDRWGPLQDHMLHFSFGTGTHFLLLKDEVDGQLQGAVSPLPGQFRSGAHRARFNPQDGQLYVTGMQGWGSYTSDDGSFERVRYTGDRVQLPVAFRAHENGVMVEFTEAVDPAIAQNPMEHFAQCWNYRYGPGYGSPEFAPSHFGMQGHDVLSIESAHVVGDGRKLFLEIPELQPVNQLHLLMATDEDESRELFATVHKLADPFTAFPGYKPSQKTINPHPILGDLLLATKSIPNPWEKRGGHKDARPITLQTAGNLSFATREITATAGESIQFTLENPDVVPHNWALLKPGTLQRVGEMANHLVADPEAVIRQYVPDTEDVLVYTDIVSPRSTMTIWFKAPEQPGRYPYLCTFPGHWPVMNGVMVVE